MLQIGETVIRNPGRIITNCGGCYKLGQLSQIGAQQVCPPSCMSYHEAIGELVITGRAHCLSF